MTVKDKNQLRDILQNNKIVAVVGFSTNETKGGYYVPKYLKEQGYQVVPINPTISEGLGEKAYASLEDIPFKVDIVDCFRRAEAMPEIAQQAVKIGAKVLWMQKGIVSDQAAKIAQDGGMTAVQDFCMLELHKELIAKL